MIKFLTLSLLCLLPLSVQADMEWTGLQDDAAWMACGYAGTNALRSVMGQWLVPAIITDFAGFAIIGATHDQPGQSGRVFHDLGMVSIGVGLEGVLNGLTFGPLTGGGQVSYLIKI